MSMGLLKVPGTGLLLLMALRDLMTLTALMAPRALMVRTIRSDETVYFPSSTVGPLRALCPPGMEWGMGLDWKGMQNAKCKMQI